MLTIITSLSHSNRTSSLRGVARDLPHKCLSLPGPNSSNINSKLSNNSRISYSSSSSNSREEAEKLSSKTLITI